MTNKALNDKLRNDNVKRVADFFTAQGEEVLRIASGELCFPCLDDEGNEKFIQICVKVPTGSREDKEAFDGYGLAEQYKEKCETAAAKKAKKEQAERERAERIAARKAKQADK